MRNIGNSPQDGIEPWVNLKAYSAAESGALPDFAYKDVMGSKTLQEELHPTQMAGKPVPGLPPALIAPINSSFLGTSA
jgi:hypothetical protein